MPCGSIPAVEGASLFAWFPPNPALGRASEVLVLGLAQTYRGFAKPRERAVMVGDRMHDIAGARANGIAAIAVGYGYGTREELEGAGAERVAESVTALGRLLGL